MHFSIVYRQWENIEIQVFVLNVSFVNSDAFSKDEAKLTVCSRGATPVDDILNSRHTVYHIPI